VYRLIHKLRDEGSTVICVAHDMILLAEVVERMVVLRDSFIIADAKPKEVFSDRELMRSTHLVPPQITELALRLKTAGKFSEIELNVNDMVAGIASRLGK
jgi:energy-coupling factor transport system ATP-binding protein